MDQTTWLEPLFESIKKVLRSAWNLVWKWPVAIAMAIAVFALMFDLADVLRRSYVSHYEKRFAVYAGPQGSSSYYTGRDLQSLIERVSPAPGTNFHSSVVPLASTSEVYDRVRADTQGESIGVTADKTKDVDGIRTLLPLDWEYLHVLANVKFLEGICKEAQAAGSPASSQLDRLTEFSGVVRKLKYGRVYCDGASLDLASELIRRCWATERKGISDFLAPGISNWDAAVAALKENHLDVLFFSGRLGATSVRTIAEEQTAVLLGLDDLATALNRDYEPSLVVTKFPTNSYSETSFHIGNPPVDIHFCGDKLTTVATRRLIIASSAMSKDDAHLISTALSNSLSQDDGQPDNTWKRISPENETLALTDHAPFGIAPHSGSLAALRGVTRTSVFAPGTWSTSSKAFSFAVLLFFVTKGLKWYSKSAPALEQPSPKNELPGERVTTLISEIKQRSQDPQMPRDVLENSVNEVKELFDELLKRVDEPSRQKAAATRLPADKVITPEPP
ncbi:MAG: hypothetical protein ACJ8LM_00740, partial [Candidatus Udaeobacter sp.]